MSAELLFIEELCSSQHILRSSLDGECVRAIILISSSSSLYLFPDTVEYKPEIRDRGICSRNMGIERVRGELARGARAPLRDCDKIPDYLDAIRRGRRTGDRTEYCKSLHLPMMRY